MDVGDSVVRQSYIACPANQDERGVIVERSYLEHWADGQSATPSIYRVKWDGDPIAGPQWYSNRTIKPAA